MSTLIAVLYRDLWGPIWPNLAASVIWAPAALWWHHSRLRRHVSAEVTKVRNEMMGTNVRDEGVSR